MPDLIFRKASASGGNNSNGCVEVADLPAGAKAIRDSKDRGGPVLRFTAHEWACFTDGVVRGEFGSPGLTTE